MATEEKATGDKTSRKESTAKTYLKCIEAYENEFQKWEKRAEKIVKRYRDDREETEKSRQKLNVFWSNVEIMTSVMYANMPKTQVERRFKDKDPLGRTASQIIERATDYEIDDSDFDEIIQQAVLDLALAGRGQTWELYEPELSDKKKTGERTRTIYLDYRDFGHEVGRTWADVRKVWRKVWMTTDQVKERWGKAIADELEYDTDHNTEKNKNVSKDRAKKACVYEVWDKTTKMVYWVSKNRDKCIEEYEYPLNLRNGFPCPRPAMATRTNDTMISVADFVQYQNQLTQIDKLTARIGNLTDALKVVGVYDATVPALQRLLHPDGVADNTLVPVKKWAEFVTKGGLASSVDFVPIKEVAEALIKSYEALEQAKQAMYEVTGLADIIRGASDPRETLGAQQLKSQHGSIRIRRRQGEVARFVRDVLRIKAEIICEQFEPDTLWDITNARELIEDQPLPPQLQQAQQMVPPEQFQAIAKQAMEQAKRAKFEEAIQLLRDDRMRTFRMDIETDSTIKLDEQQAKADAVEFVTAVGTFLKGAMEAVAMDPRIAPVMGETLTYVVRQYKAGRQLEGAIEQYVEQIKQPQPPKPDPEMAKVEAEAKAKQAELQMEGEFKKQELQLKAQELQAKTQLKLVETKAKVEGEQQKMQMEAQGQAQEMQMKQQMGQQEMAMRQQEGEQQMALQREQGQQQAAIAREKNHMDADNKREAAKAKKNAS